MSFKSLDDEGGVLLEMLSFQVLSKEGDYCTGKGEPSGFGTSHAYTALHPSPIPAPTPDTHQLVKMKISSKQHEFGVATLKLLGGQT